MDANNKTPFQVQNEIDYTKNAQLDRHDFDQPTEEHEI